MNTIERELLGRCKHALIYNDASDLEILKDLDDCLAKPVQEPVAWLYFDKNAGANGYLKVCETLPRENGSFPVYTSP
jgi:hypothetical protein